MTGQFVDAAAVPTAQVGRGVRAPRVQQALRRLSLRRRHERAFTLAECLLATVILVAAVSATMLPLVVGQSQTAYALHTQQATRLCEEMMDRILACPYAQVVATYNTSTENPGGLRDAAGVAFPAEYQVFKRVVGAQTSTQTIANLGGAIPGLAVTVTVSDTDGKAWVISRFIPQ